MEKQTFTRKELYDLVWSQPMLSLSKKYNISDVGLRKMCIRMSIPMPKPGHWQKLQFGKKVSKVPLPKEIGTLDQNLPEIIQFAYDFFTNHSKYFAGADLTAKRQLIGSIFPEKLVFDEKNFRTIKVLSTIEWMMRRGKDSKGLNKKKASKNGGQFNVVPRTGLASFWALIFYRQCVSELCRKK